MLQVADLLEDHDLVFAEVYYTFLPYLKVAAAEHGFEVRTVFLHPLIPNVNPDAIVSTMEGKLQRRKTDSLEKIHERARSAPTEMQCAVEHATHQIINLAGEDDVEEWGALGTRDGQKGSRPIGSLTDLGDAAQWLVKEFVRVARGELPSGTYTRT
jgi:guanylate kinase